MGNIKMYFSTPIVHLLIISSVIVHTVSNEDAWHVKEEDPKSIKCMFQCIVYQYSYCNSTIQCHDGQERVKDGSYCGCCDACYTIADEGQHCQGKHEYGQYFKCKEGLRCDELTHVCMNFTSYFDIFVGMIQRYFSVNN